MTDRKDNRWCNYETRCVGSWIETRGTTRGYWQEEARAIREQASECWQEGDAASVDERAVDYLADQLNEAFIDEIPSDLDTVYFHLILSAFRAIKWEEIAQWLIADIAANDRAPETAAVGSDHKAPGTEGTVPSDSRQGTPRTPPRAVHCLEEANGRRRV